MKRMIHWTTNRSLRGIQFTSNFLPLQVKYREKKSLFDDSSMSKLISIRIPILKNCDTRILVTPGRVYSLEPWNFWITLDGELRRSCRMNRGYAKFFLCNVPILTIVGLYVDLLNFRFDPRHEEKPPFLALPAVEETRLVAVRKLPRLEITHKMRITRYLYAAAARSPCFANESRGIRFCPR